MPPRRILHGQRAFEEPALGVGGCLRKTGVRRLLLQQRSIERLDTSLRRPRRHPRTETREHLNPAEPSSLELQPGRPHLRLHRHRDVQLHRLADIETVEAGLYHADDFERMTVDGDRAADDGRIAIEAHAPVRESKYGD